MRIIKDYEINCFDAGQEGLRSQGYIAMTTISSETYTFPTAATSSAGTTSSVAKKEDIMGKEDFMDKVDRKTHLKLTYTFAIASVGTLALIIGIISFMMWPGTEAYYTTGSASDAFFGTNTFPHMFLRIGFMIMMSGIIGMIISSAMRKENKELSEELTQKMGWVSLLGGFVTVFFFMWYIDTLPANAHALLGMAKDSIIMNRVILAILFSIYFSIAIIKPQWVTRALAITMMFVIGIV